ncbi:caspase domain-containing protein [Hysterangium stoloniferum]|nr:caspase domain-containing protein [Hysterangium stoloniferum]
MFPASPRKKALCVGVSYKGQNGPYGQSADSFQLLAVHSDVGKVRKLLIDKYGYKDEHIKVLLDAERYESPTRANILTAMEELVAGAEAGDYLFFFFAGHGDQITNHDGKEVDGKDEIILPIDWELDPELPIEARDRYRQIIIDDEMNEILVKGLRTDCRLTALFDSCHSGTMLDLPYGRSFGPRSSTPPFDRPTIVMTERCESPTVGRMPTHYEETMGSHGSLETEGVPVESIAEGSVDRSHINRHTRRGPLDLDYVLPAMSPRGRTHPLWRKGTWVLRGESRDEKIKPPPEKRHAVDNRFHFGYVQRALIAILVLDLMVIVFGWPKWKVAQIIIKAFVKILRDEPYRTYRDILECLGDRLKVACEKRNKNFEEPEWIMQEPQLGSQHQPDIDSLFAP